MSWRKNTSWLNPNSDNTSTIQALIGHFLQDRFSPSLLDEEVKKFQEKKRGASWGEPPYEKVVESEADLDGSLTIQVLIETQFALLSQQVTLAKTMLRRMSGRQVISLIYAGLSLTVIPSCFRFGSWDSLTRKNSAIFLKPV